MRVTQTEFPGLKLIEPTIYKDQRGYFFESYNYERMRDAGIDMIFTQDNQSRSQYGVIRGLHFQKKPFAQTKLIRVLQGKIYDVALDLRQKSPCFGKWYGLELSDENQYQLLIPKGFAHGFSVLSDYAVVFYKCDETYKPGSEDGILYSDPDLNIDWKIPPNLEIISVKDQGLKRFKESVLDFKYTDPI